MVTRDFALSLSIPKTKAMAVGREVTSNDRTPLSIGDDEIETVNEFPYLDSVVSSTGRIGH